MGLKMTLRLEGKEEETLNILAKKLTYSEIKSKAVRYALEFTRQCLNNLKLGKDESYWRIQEKMNTKYKTSIDDWRYR